MAQILVLARQAFFSGCTLREACLDPALRQAEENFLPCGCKPASRRKHVKISHNTAIVSPDAVDAEPSFSGHPPGTVHRRRRRQPHMPAGQNASTGETALKAAAASATLALPEAGRRQERVASSPLLDSWLQQSLLEIIKHLQEAPFIHLYFNNKGSRRTSDRTVRCQVAEHLFHDTDSWTSVRDAVLENEPDGVILVHRLGEGDAAKCYGAEYSGVSSSDHASSVGDHGLGTAVWGLVVQSRGSKRHGCYILKTTRVFSMAGACTRFSLTRAKCFGPALHQQLENSWLV